MHQADRLVGSAATGAGDAGNGDHQIGIGFAQRAARHRLDCLPADRAVVFQNLRGHT